MTSSIVFIDSRVADYQALIAGLAEGTEWFLLNAEEDGVDQMARILASYSSLDSIQVISHGSEGTLYIGSTVLNSENITRYESQLQAIGASLTDTGDILLYGCNVGAGETGMQFIQALAGYTGADVAASDDVTGSTSLGGNWQLEVITGNIDTAALSQPSFNATLSSPTVNSIAATSVSFSGINIIDAELSGTKWGGALGTGVTLSYSFANAGSYWATASYEYGLNTGGGEPWNGFAALTGTQQIAVRNALATWSSVANISFIEVTDSQTTAGDLRFAWTTAATGQAHAYGPGSNARSADIWLNSNVYWDGFGEGSFGYLTLIHEIGHALGLEHTFSGAYTLPSNVDGYPYSVMSYSAFPGTSPSYVDFNPTTPMWNDIAAIQYLYGANTGNNSGDDTYTFHQGQSYFQTIVDTGGTDTIAWDGTTQSATIDLRASNWSDLGNALIFTNSFGSVIGINSNSVVISDSSVFENATGGGAADLLYGNAVANDLNGGSGNDVMYGFEENDRFDWDGALRAGTDTMYGGDGDDTYVIDSITDVVVELAGEGTDTIWSAITYSLASAANTENLYLFGTVSINGTGNESDNMLLGNSTANALVGGAGNDILIGGSGADTLTGGLGNDVFGCTSAGDSTVSNCDVITDFELGDKIEFAGIAGVSLYGAAYTYTTSIAATISSIQNNSAIANQVVFFSDGVDGFVYVKGAGTGTNFDGSLVKITGQTAAPILTQMPSISAGNTQPTFWNGDGMLTTDLVSGNDDGKGVYVLSDGKILVAGSTGYHDFGLVRYMPNGSLDASFSEDGRVTTDMGGNGYDVANAIVLRADGRILLAGQGVDTLNSDYDFSLASYNADGSLDTTFGDGGKISVDVGVNTSDEALSVALQADGKIVVAGYSYGTQREFSITRLNSNGSLDSAFDGDGKKVSALVGVNGIGYGSSAHDLAIQTDGKVVVAGEVNSSYVLVGGLRSYRSDVAVVRYNTDGTLDTSFGIGGQVVTSIGQRYDVATAVALQSDGKIVVAGYGDDGTGRNQDCLLIRYNTDGSLDTSFAGDGSVFVAVSPSNASELIYDLLIQPDGKIVIGGSINGDFGLVRFSSDGQLDTSFGVGGVAIAGVTSGSDTLYSLALQSNGKIVASGSSFVGNGIDTVFSLARFETDGSLDNRFDSSVLDTLSSGANFTEGGTATVLDTSVQIYDAELAIGGNFSGAQLTLVRQGGANAQDVFSATGTLSFADGFVSLNGLSIGTVANSAGTLTLSFFDGTQSQINSVMRQIAYRNSSDAPPAFVQIDWTFSDGNTGTQGAGGALSTTGSTTVNITSVNDAPTSVAGAVSGTEDSSYTFTVADFPFSDPDAGSALAKIKVVSLPSSSTLLLNGVAVTAGLEVSTSVLNAGLVTYTPAANATGAETFSFAVSDGTVFSPNSLMTVNLANINDTPTGSVTISGTATQGQTLTAGNTLADADGLGTISYQWQSSSDGSTWSNVSTGTTLSLTETLVGKQIKVVASYTDAGGAAESVTSSTTAAVVGFNSGNDILTATSGNDTLDGGVGIDTADYSNAASGVTLNLALTIAQNSGGSGSDTLLNIENLVGGQYDDVLIGNSASNQLDGGSGNDIFIDSAPGNTMVGSNANDTYYVDNVNDVIVETFTGTGNTDLVNSFLADYTLGSNIEAGRIRLGSSANLTGNELSNSLTGGAGNNILGGRLGNDTLTGGAGADTFRFDTALNATTNLDTLTDFTSGTDKIQLENAIFASLSATGTLSVSMFRSGAGITTAADANDYLIYNSSTGAMYYDPDGSGSTASIQFAMVSSHPVLTNADFMVS